MSSQANAEALARGLDNIADALTAISQVLRGGGGGAQQQQGTPKKKIQTIIWSAEEYKQFEQAWEEHGYDVDKLAEAVPTRSRKAIKAEAELYSKARRTQTSPAASPVSHNAAEDESESSSSSSSSAAPAAPPPLKKSKSTDKSSK